MNLDVELSSEITALNTPIEAWANVTDSAGNPQSGQTVEIRHEAEGFSTSGVTASNGSFWTTIQVGDETDTSATVDWASRITPPVMVCGVATITLDENIVMISVAGLERANILRNRSGELTT